MALQERTPLLAGSLTSLKALGYGTRSSFGYVAKISIARSCRTSCGRVTRSSPRARSPGQNARPPCNQRLPRHWTRRTPPRTPHRRNIKADPRKTESGDRPADVVLTRASGSVTRIDTARSAQWVARNRLRNQPRPDHSGAGSMSRRSLTAPPRSSDASTSGSGCYSPTIRFARAANSVRHPADLRDADGPGGGRPGAAHAVGDLPCDPAR